VAVIRRATEDELAAVGRLTVAAYVSDGLLDPQHPYAQELLDTSDRYHHAEVLVAVDDAGTLVGTVTYCRPGTPYAEIARSGESEFRMLAVDPAARGTGIARALVEVCMERAAAAGDEAIVLSTRREMVAAGRLYRRLGFRRLPERDWSPRPGIDLLAYIRPVVLDGAT
jgi:ribosomal protein S18 acetylase RimI-like enzyme